MQSKIKMVGMEYDTTDIFKKMTLTFDLFHYSNNVNEHGCIYAMFEIETGEGDFKLGEDREETLRFKSGYTPRNLNIKTICERQGVTKNQNILGTKECYKIVDIFLQALKTEDIYINLSLTPRTIDRLSFDFKTEHPEMYVDDY